MASGALHTMGHVARTTGRVLARHWPALAAWYLGMEIAHEAFIQLAGFVASYWTVGGLLILPLAIISRVVAFVAMLLVARPSLSAIQAVAPEETTFRGHAREFFSATMAAMLPFLIFYTVWGLLFEDLRRFSFLAIDYAVRITGTVSGGVDDDLDAGGYIQLTWVPVVIVAAAFLLRLLSARFADRLPGWTAPFTVYVEALWASLLFTFVTQQILEVRRWVEDRSAVEWLHGVGEWLREHSPLAWGIFDGGGWFFSNLGDALLLPLAWITVAAIVYGETFDDASAPAPRRSLRTVVRSMGRRVDELWDALTLVFRAGPLVAACFVLVYATWAMGERLLTLASVRMFGPAELSFWNDWGNAIATVAAAVAEVVRIALIAAMVDAVVERLQSSGVHLEAEPVVGSGGAEVEHERPARVFRQQEVGPDRVGVVGEPGAGAG